MRLNLLGLTTAVNQRNLENRRPHQMLYSDRDEIEVSLLHRVTLLLVAVTTFFKDAKQVSEEV